LDNLARFLNVQPAHIYFRVTYAGISESFRSGVSRKCGLKLPKIIVNRNQLSVKVNGQQPDDPLAHLLNVLSPDIEAQDDKVHRL
jgi:hypothetical protein